MNAALIIGGGAAVVVVAHLLGKRAAAAAAPSSNAALEACKAAGIPEIACRAGFGALGAGYRALKNTLQTSDGKNKELNGAATVKLSPAHMAPIAKTSSVGGGGSGDMNPSQLKHYPIKGPFTIQYANGCVPIPGHPGYKLCQPGTQSMVAGDWFAKSRGDGKSAGALLTGDPARDALTFRWPADKPFPWVAGDGEAWIVRGVPIRCPAGQTVNRGTDHRLVAGPPCAGAVGPQPHSSTGTRLEGINRPPPTAGETRESTPTTRDRRTQ